MLDKVGSQPWLHQHHVNVAAGTVTLVAIIAGAAYLHAKHQPPLVHEPQQPLSEAIRIGEVPIPPLTDTTRAKLTMSHGFQVLVSYTDRGFEPATIAIRHGDTVRFTNNSSQPMRLLVNAAVTPGPDLMPQQFSEITFDEVGTFRYADARNPISNGTARVE